MWKSEHNLRDEIVRWMIDSICTNAVSRNTNRQNIVMKKYKKSAFHLLLLVAFFATIDDSFRLSKSRNQCNHMLKHHQVMYLWTYERDSRCVICESFTIIILLPCFFSLYLFSVPIMCKCIVLCNTKWIEGKMWNISNYFACGFQHFTTQWQHSTT